MQRLRDATVVISGASSGIGLETARASARRGAGVALTARRRELLEEAARLRGTRRAGARGTGRRRDRFSPGAASAFGGIEVWVNNAGTSMWGPFEEIPLKSVRRA